MTATAYAPAHGHAGTRGSTRAAFLSAAVIVTAAALHLFDHTNTDVSWLLTIGERWAAGERPYVDIVEVNPPASILLYWPAIALGRLLGIGAEAAVVVLVVCGAVASVVLTCRVLRRGDLMPARGAGLQMPAMLALVLLAPAGDFAEREHVALLAVLPLLAVLAARAGGKPPSWRTALLAGLGGGVALAIKPIFGLGLIGPLAYVIARRGWRSAISTPELHAAWVIPALYGASIPICFPRFTSDILHLVLVAYVPVRFALSELLLSRLGLLVADGCFIALCLRALVGFGAWPHVLLSSGIGFYAAFLLQGKAWAYQGLPALLLVGLSALAAIGALGNTVVERRIRILASAALGGLAVAAGALFSIHPTMGAAIPGLEAALAEVGSHPTLMAITSDIAVGHPLVREVAGRWVGTFPAEWVTASAKRLRAGGVSSSTDQELERLSQQERTITTRDVVSKRPDAILVQGAEWQRYVEETPALNAAFKDYDRRADYGPVTLWVRRPP